MENNTLAIAFSELYEIFKMMNEDDLKKIPNEFKEFIIQNKLSGYKPVIDKDIPLYSQKLKKETLTICSLIYRTYLISPEQRHKLQDDKKI